MSQENQKISKIKSSCNAVAIVTRIFLIIVIVGLVITLIAGVVIIANGEKLDPIMEESLSDTGSFDVTQQVGPLNLHLVNISSDDLTDGLKLESSIPGMQEYLDEAPYSFSIGLILLVAAFSLIVSAFILFMLSSAFTIIQKADSPFTDTVIKRLMAALISIDVVMAFSLGVGFGVIGALITWAVYTIMDYGRLLQTQSDETL